MLRQARLCLGLASVLLGAGLGLGLPATASAQSKRVVIERFRGPQASRFRAMLIANLQDQDNIEIVSEREVQHRAEALGINRIRPDDYPRVAQELGVAAFVDGRTGRRRRTWTLSVRVRTAADGSMLGAESWSGRTVASLGSIRRNGYRRLLPYLDAARAPGGGRRGRGQAGGAANTARGQAGARGATGASAATTAGARGQTTARTPAAATARTPAAATARTPATATARTPATATARGQTTASTSQRGATASGGATPWYAQGATAAPRGGGTSSARASSSGALASARGHGGELGGGGEEDEPDREAEPETDPAASTAASETGGASSDTGQAGSFFTHEEEPDTSEHDDALYFAVLLGTLYRSLETQVDSPSRGTEPRTYNSGGIGHGEVGLEVEAYPGAFGDKPAFPYLGVVASYRHSVFLTSQGCMMSARPEMCPTGQGVDVETSQSEIYLGARGRVRFGDTRQSPHVFADVGWGLFSFDLNPEQLLMLDEASVIPPLDYQYVQLGVGGSYGLVPTYLTVGVQLAYRLGLGIGSDGQRVWGTATTDTGGFTGTFEVRSEAPYVVPGAFFALRLSYFQFTTQFQGEPACALPPPMECTAETDPWELLSIPNPVTDHYFRLTVALGGSLR